LRGSARAFTAQLSPRQIAPWDVGYDYAGNSPFPLPGSHRPDMQHYGLHQKVTKETKWAEADNL